MNTPGFLRSRSWPPIAGLGEPDQPVLLAALVARSLSTQGTSSLTMNDSYRRCGAESMGLSAYHGS